MTDEGKIYECRLCVYAFDEGDQGIWCFKFHENVDNSDAEKCEKYNCVIQTDRQEKGRVKDE